MPEGWKRLIPESLLSMVRIAGVTTGATSWLVQLQTEKDTKAIQARLATIEDPISALHPDIRAVSKLLHEALSRDKSTLLDFDSSFYADAARPLALLEAHGLIKGVHTIGGRFYGGLVVSSPFYVIYMCALFAESKKMDRLVDIIDGCEAGRSLRGESVSEEVGLPLSTVRALFQVYESKGLGTCSKEVGATAYRALA